MKYLLVVVAFLYASYTFAQPTTLQVLGQYTYTNHSQSYGAIIVLEENPNKCDPVLGFISIEEQYKHLSESIVSKGSTAKLELVKDHTYSEYKKETYRIEEPNAEIFEDIIAACNNQNATVKKRYYKLPTSDFASQDDKAVEALIDAKQKAEEITNHIDYKIIKILNIDDDTKIANSMIDLTGKDAAYIEKVMHLMELLSHISNSNESKQATQDGKYSLWVTFEVEAN